MEINSTSESEGRTLTTRETILRGFEVWLDEVLARGEPPQGMIAELMRALESGDSLPSIEGQCDLYSLWSAMTALTQEVKLQSRTFKQLKDTLAQVLDAAQESRKDDSLSHSKIAEEFFAVRREMERRVRREQIDLLLDLRDRLVRGIEIVRRTVPEPASPTLFSKLALWLPKWQRGQKQTQDRLAALDKGYTLTLDRLEQALGDYRLSPILCEGETFDPHRMTAVEAEETAVVPEGTVMGVYRNGYEWEGEVYRPAQVKVARSPRE
jgi:molecular chaperone GrpE